MRCLRQEGLLLLIHAKKTAILSPENEMVGLHRLMVAAAVPRALVSRVLCLQESVAFGASESLPQFAKMGYWGQLTAPLGLSSKCPFRPDVLVSDGNVALL